MQSAVWPLYLGNRLGAGDFIPAEIGLKRGSVQSTGATSCRREGKRQDEKKRSRSSDVHRHQTPFDICAFSDAATFLASLAGNDKIVPWLYVKGHGVQFSAAFSMFSEKTGRRTWRLLCFGPLKTQGEICRAHWGSSSLHRADIVSLINLERTGTMWKQSVHFLPLHAAVSLLFNSVLLLGFPLRMLSWDLRANHHDLNLTPDLSTEAQRCMRVRASHPLCGLFFPCVRMCVFVSAQTERDFCWHGLTCVSVF